RLPGLRIGADERESAPSLDPDDVAWSATAAEDCARLQCLGKTGVALLLLRGERGRQQREGSKSTGEQAHASLDTLSDGGNLVRDPSSVVRRSSSTVAPAPRERLANRARSGCNNWIRIERITARRTARIDPAGRTELQAPRSTNQLLGGRGALDSRRGQQDDGFDGRGARRPPQTRPARCNRGLAVDRHRGPTCSRLAAAAESSVRPPSSEASYALVKAR